LPDPEILTPQTIGDLVGRAVRVYRANIRHWAPLLLWPTITVLIGRVIYQTSAFSFQQNQSQLPALGFLLSGLSIVIVGKWWLSLKLLAFVRLSNRFANSLDDAMSYMKRRKWKLAGIAVLCLTIFSAVSTLWMLEIIAAAVLLKISMIPAVFAMVFGFLGFVVSFAFIIFAFFLSIAALACEDSGVTTLLSRGFTLSSKNFWRTMWCGLIAAITVNLIATPLWLPISVLGSLDAVRAGGAMQGLPLHWQVTVVAWETLIEMITQPILLLAYGFYYYDLRLRYEGVDVLECLETIKLKQRALLE
jgi:hypothetical protein